MNSLEAFHRRLFALKDDLIIEIFSKSITKSISLIDAV
jgi:hypothetical protein